MKYNPMRSTEKKVRDLETLLKMLPEGLTGLEIGSYAGESAAIFAASGKFKKLYCADPWDPKYYKGDQLIAAEANFDKTVAKYSNIIVKVKGTSSDFFLSEISLTTRFDFVYIDGNHKYQFVKEDLINAVQLLEASAQSGGKKILAGHDYGFERSPDVKVAVKEVLGYPDARFCYYSWIKFL